MYSRFVEFLGEGRDRGGQTALVPLKHNRKKSRPDNRTEDVRVELGDYGHFRPANKRSSRLQFADPNPKVPVEDRI